jgi:hypothetical protein
MRWLKVDYDKEYKAMRDIIHPPGGHTNKFSFLNEYRSMVSNTENWVKEQEDDEEIEHVFEEMVEWQSKFCVLRPINPNDSEEAMALVKHGEQFSTLMITRSWRLTRLQHLESKGLFHAIVQRTFTIAGATMLAPRHFIEKLSQAIHQTWILGLSLKEVKKVVLLRQKREELLAEFKHSIEDN